MPDLLIGHLNEHKGYVEMKMIPHLDNLIELVKQRDAFGRAKYGQPLMTNDGRNGLEDARQEMGDLLQYICKVIEAKEATSEDLLIFMEDFSMAYKAGIRLLQKGRMKMKE